MKISRMVFFVLWMLLPQFLLLGQEDAIAQMKKMEPFVGKWETRSVYPDRDRVMPGKLEYRWILGKNWLCVEFVGQHPEREYWEAYALIKYDPVKKRYLSYEYFNANEPTIMTGYWISADTIRFEFSDEKGSAGIDYTLIKKGTDYTVYQENWVMPSGGERKITLKTDYTAVK